MLHTVVTCYRQSTLVTVVTCYSGPLFHLLQSSLVTVVTCCVQPSQVKYSHYFFHAVIAIYLSQHLTQLSLAAVVL
jgi:hypothetical protein